VSLDHQLIDRFQLSIVKSAYFFGLDVGHVNGSCVFKVLEGFGDEQAEHFQVCTLDCVENLQTFRSEMLGQLKCLSLEWLMHVLWESMKEE